MKWSQHNYLFHYKKIDLLYNSLSNTFIELDEEQLTHINKIKTNPKKHENEEFFKELEKYKVFVKSDEIEYNKLKFGTILGRMNSQVLNLTIAPTLDCNFRCVYCYEEGRIQESMTLDTSDAIISFIKHQPSLKRINLTWYGGEPLLSLDKIKYITSKIKLLGIDFDADMVTNGYLLTDDVVKQLIDFKVSHLQITVDGTQKTHDQRRFLKDRKGTYDTIMNNIQNLIKNYNEIFVSIRVNVDKNNEAEFINVYNDFHNRFSTDSFNIYPGFTEDINACLNSTDCFLNQKEIGDFKLRMFEEYKIDLGLFPDNGRNECMARSINSYLIGPNGDLYKCWNDIGIKSKVVGNLKANNFLINSDLLTQYLVGEDQLDDVQCKKCFFLPICIGGCPHRRLFAKHVNKKNTLCHLAKDKLENFLSYYYDLKTSKEQIK